MFFPISPGSPCIGECTWSSFPFPIALIEGMKTRADMSDHEGIDIADDVPVLREQLRWSFETLVSADGAEEPLRATLIDDAIDLTLDQLEYLAEDKNLRRMKYSDAAHAEIGPTIKLLLEMVEEHGAEFQRTMSGDLRWPELIGRVSAALAAMES
jgi:hypothetical protein